MHYNLPKDEIPIEGGILNIEKVGPNIITLGVLKNGYAVVNQLTVPNYDKFKEYCIGLAQNSPKPWRGYGTIQAAFLNLETRDFWNLQQFETRDFGVHDSDIYMTS